MKISIEIEKISIEIEQFSSEIEICFNLWALRVEVARVFFFNFFSFGCELLGGTFRIFLLFSARGRGRGSPRRREGGGGRFFIENPRMGRLPGGWGRGVRGREGVCGEFGGGGG